jgi:hypothetical protein
LKKFAPDQNLRLNFDISKIKFASYIQIFRLIE